MTNQSTKSTKIKELYFYKHKVFIYNNISYLTLQPFSVLECILNDKYIKRLISYGYIMIKNN